MTFGAEPCRYHSANASPGLGLQRFIDEGKFFILDAFADPEGRCSGRL